MHKIWIMVLLALACTAPAVAQTDQEKDKQTKQVETSDKGTVTITSSGKDVREILTLVFSQAKKNFVLEKTPRFDLFLALNNVDFEETLQIICNVADLQYEIQNGIYFIKKAAAKGLITNSQAPTTPGKLQGKLNDSVLAKKVTTRISKTDFRDVIKNIAKQTDVWIETESTLSPKVIDAFLIDTTLKQALDMITQALGLDYKFTENQSILIYKPNPNKVTVLDKGP